MPSLLVPTSSTMIVSLKIVPLIDLLLASPADEVLVVDARVLDRLAVEIQGAGRVDPPRVKDGVAAEAVGHLDAVGRCSCRRRRCR